MLYPLPLLSLIAGIIFCIVSGITWIIVKTINAKRRRANLPFFNLSKEKEVLKLVPKEMLKRLKVIELVPEKVNNKVLTELFKKKIFIRFYKDYGKTDDMTYKEYSNIKASVVNHNIKLLEILKKSLIK